MSENKKINVSVDCEYSIKIKLNGEYIGINDPRLSKDDVVNIAEAAGQVKKEMKQAKKDAEKWRGREDSAPFYHGNF